MSFPDHLTTQRSRNDNVVALECRHCGERFFIHEPWAEDRDAYTYAVWHVTGQHGIRIEDVRPEPGEIDHG